MDQRLQLRHGGIALGAVVVLVAVHWALSFLNYKDATGYSFWAANGLARFGDWLWFTVFALTFGLSAAAFYWLFVRIGRNRQTVGGKVIYWIMACLIWLFAVTFVVPLSLQFVAFLKWVLVDVEGGRDILENVIGLPFMFMLGLWIRRQFGMPPHVLEESAAGVRQYFRDRRARL